MPRVKEARAKATPACAKIIRFISARLSNARSRCGNSTRCSNPPAKASHSRRVWCTKMRRNVFGIRANVSRACICKTHCEAAHSGDDEKFATRHALCPSPRHRLLDVQQTLIAFNARRDATKPAGEYDFALRPNESYRPIPTLSVTDLEAMVSSPAIVWMKRYLGVEAPDDAANPWAATSGKWVHRWLADIGETNGNEKIFARFSDLGKDRRTRSLFRRRTAHDAAATLQLVRQSRSRLVDLGLVECALSRATSRRKNCARGRLGWMATEFADRTRRRGENSR